MLYDATQTKRYLFIRCVWCSCASYVRGAWLSWDHHERGAGVARVGVDWGTGEKVREVRPHAREHTT